MGGFGHIHTIIYHTIWIHHRVGIIRLTLLEIIHFLFLLVVVKVVWVLGSPIFMPRKLIVGLMVLILNHLRIGIVQPWSITKNTDPLICHIGGRRINSVIMVILEVVLVLVPPISPPRDFILVQTGMMRDSIHIWVIAQHSLWYHLGLGVIQLNMPTFINSVFLMVMLEVLLVLGAPTPPPRKCFYFWVGKSKSFFLTNIS